MLGNEMKSMLKMMGTLFFVILLAVLLTTEKRGGRVSEPPPRAQEAKMSGLNRVN